MTAQTSIPQGVRTALGLVPDAPHYFFYRHRWPVRISHWLNAIILVVMLMSGLGIFNAHPALYWGQGSDFSHPAVMLVSNNRPDGSLGGVTVIGGHVFNTTGILGASDQDGSLMARGFPAWATLPGPIWLAMSRQWHFAFAWLLVANAAFFFVYGFLSRHFRRDLAPTAQDIAHLPGEIADHARLRFHHGERARHYNALQKLTYCFVLFVLAPLILLTGLTMSPTIDTGYPWLLVLFGGRQSARTIHFICAFSLLGFVIIHVAMVILSGTWNNLRSMLTGWYAIRKDAKKDAPKEAAP